MTPKRRLKSGEADSIKIEIIPVRGLERLDYVSEDLLASIESPSIALPGDHYSGRIVVYPLKGISCTVRGYIELDKNMASIGKKGVLHRSR
jgi:hypothetical protein